jgi:hypothetical protein
MKTLRGISQETREPSQFFSLSSQRKRTRWWTVGVTVVVALAVLHPQPSSAASCSGVNLTPASNVQKAIDSRPPGTTFCFAAGTYHVKQRLIPKSSDVLWGAPGAILTGDNVTNQAIYGLGDYQSKVTVKGFIIKQFVGSAKSGAGAVKTGNGWQVLNNEIASNGHTAVEPAKATVVSGNYIHDNKQWGITGYAGSGVKVQNNELARNGNRSFGLASTGAIKFMKSTNLTISGNNVHHNVSHAIHCDTDCRYVTYASNTVVANSGVGIFHEMSFDATISNNVVKFNDTDVAGKSLVWGANIFLNDSSNTQIYGNTVESSVAGVLVNGIGLSDRDRGSGPYGVYQIANVSVHDNIIKMHVGAATGLTGNAHNPRTKGNSFVHNTYYVDNVLGGYWSWVTFPLTWSQWRAAKQDLTGSCLKWL